MNSHPLFTNDKLICFSILRAPSDRFVKFVFGNKIVNGYSLFHMTNEIIYRDLNTMLGMLIIERSNSQPYFHCNLHIFYCAQPVSIAKLGLHNWEQKIFLEELVCQTLLLDWLDFQTITSKISTD